MPEPSTLYLIDGHAVAYRQFFGLAKGRFVTSQGEPTAASFGFTRILLDLFEHERPEYLAVSFDMGLGGRDELYSEYKANRDAMPEDLRPQLTRIQQIVEVFNIPVLTMPDQEADDVIGTIARQAEAQGVNVRIITGDRDILQLLSAHVSVQLPQRQGADKVYDPQAFEERYQIKPEQLIDLKALMGDSSDNIPGVKGVGEKTGTSLLLEYGTLEAIYENLDDIRGSVQKKLIADRDMAFLSQKLATIKCDLPLQLDLDACRLGNYDPMAVDEVFAEVEFNSLRERFRSLHDDIDFSPPFSYETHIVRTDEELKELVTVLNKAQTIVWDVETTSVDQMTAELVGIALSVDDKIGYYVPVGHIAQGAGTLFEEPVAQQLPLQDVLDAIRPALTNPDIAKIAHNASYDMTVMHRYGVDVAPVAFDTMIAEWVCDPISSNLSLKKFARNVLNITMQEIDELIGKGKNQRSMAEVTVEDVAPYAAADAVVTHRAYKYLQTQLRQLDKHDIFGKLEVPLIPIIVAMQEAGTLLDRDFLSDMSTRLTQEIHALEEMVFAESGGYGTFNINSPKQLNEVLFETLKLPVDGLKRTSHGYSTDAVTLEALQDAHPIIGLITKYRELTKLKSTYVDALPELIHPQTGRVHTSYNQTGTSTGRFSSSNPNLQNIPIRTELGREVRRAFIAPPDHVLLAVDYSQIELRIMAHISDDVALIEAFNQGQDIHRATAAAVFSVEPADVTYEQRSFAKRVNFGLMYGMGAFRLARDSDLTLADAEHFITTYFERFPGVKRYMDETEQLAIEKGYVQTLMGRRRYFPTLKERGMKGNQARAELRAAINMPIQGTAADILKVAMIHLHRELANSPLQARMILQVHDELVLEVPKAELDETIILVTDIMQSAFELKVPLIANAEYGENWRDMQDVDA
jgi:DNA polymerase-1